MITRKRRELPLNSKYGEWTILGMATPDKYNRTCYSCRCSCGKTQPISVNMLTRDKTKQCRTCSNKKLSLRKIIDEMGNTYGGWEVIKHMGMVQHGKKFRKIYTVKHVCGYTFTPKDFSKFKSRNNVRCWQCRPRKIIDENI